MENQWRDELPVSERTQMITTIYLEVLRVSGEDNKQKAWNAAAKFELKHWTNSSDRNTYMAEMQRKITSLTHNQSAIIPMQPTTTQMNGFPVQQQQQQILRARQQKRNLDQAAAPPAALAANATTTAAALGSSSTGLSLQQQQAQQLLQRLQVRFQAQQQQLIRAQQQETAQLRTQQLQRQQQLAQQHQQQGVPQEQRRQQLQQLQQQHEIARARLQQMHKAKQQQLQNKQQHFLVQKQQQLQLQTGQRPQPPAASSAQQPLDMVATQPQTVLQRQQPQVQMAQLAHAQQAAAAVPTAIDVAAAPGSATGGMDASYSERLRELKTKYWDDLVVGYKEFERVVKQKPAGQQLERVNTFLITLRRIIAVLQQDPSKPARNNKNDLDRVEAHIQKQVLPILQRLKDRARIAGTGADVEMSDSLRGGGDGVGDGDVAGVGADTVPNTTTTETETRSLSVQKVMEMCCCPISLEVMRDPVMTPSGVSYERAMIEQHLEMVGEFDPMTHEKLTKAQLYPNRMLKELVEMTLASFGPTALDEILL